MAAGDGRIYYLRVCALILSWKCKALICKLIIAADRYRAGALVQNAVRAGEKMLLFSAHGVLLCLQVAPCLKWSTRSVAYFASSIRSRT